MSILDGATGLAVYLGLKLAAYLSWSYVGVRWLDPGAGRPLGRGILLGIGRLLLGWVVGAFIAPFLLLGSGLRHLPTFYFTGLVLVRWLEWGLVQPFLHRDRRGPLEVLTAGDGRGRLWRTVGVLLSYLPDAPFLLAQGFPRGRFLC